VPTALLPDTLRLLLLLFFCLATPALQAGGDPVQSCLETAAQRQPAAVQLAEDCPPLWRELQAQPAAATPPLNGKATLMQLQFLLRSWRTTSEHHGIGQEGLGPLLAGILQPEAPNPEAAWWKAFTAWLDKLKSGDYEAQYQWLLRFLRAVTPSEAAVRVFLYASIVLLVLVSVCFIGMELHYAGVFRALPGFRRRAAAGALRRTLPQPGVPESLAGMKTVAPRRQVAALLDAVVHSLTARGAIPADATLTHRQLVRAAEMGSLPAREAFGRLVDHAEPILYGRREASEELLFACRSDADKLLNNG
jgi:hypothetical protein